MNIQAIGPSFQHNNDKVNEFMNLNDKQLRQLAALKTRENFDEKKNKRITNVLFYNAPLAAGLSEALLGDGKTKLFGRNLVGTSGRLAGGLKVAAGFAAILGAIDLLVFGAKKLIKKSDKANKFAAEHPWLTLGGMLAAGFGIVAGMNKGFAKLGKLKAPEFLQKATVRIARKLNSSKYINLAKKAVLKLADKTPSALKEIGATALYTLPTALLFGGLFHSIASKGNVNREFANNYNQLRETQMNLMKQKIDRLQEENEKLAMDREFDAEFAGIV